MLTDLTLAQGGCLGAILFLAATVRGFSGFGFSAIYLAGAALVVNPLPWIPVVFACEIAMTAFQARGLRAHVDWPRVWPLLLGVVVAIVPAVAVLASLPASLTRLTISLMVFCLGILLLSGWTLQRPLGRLGHAAVGVVAGLANAAGVGGLPAAACLSAQPLSPAVFRATMVVFLTGMDLVTIPVMSGHGLVTQETAIAAVLAMPILGAGVWVGSRAFGRHQPQQFRRLVALLLLLLSGLNLFKLIL